MSLLLFLGVLVLYLGLYEGFGVMEWIGFLVFLFLAGIITYPLRWSAFVEKLIKKSQEKNGTGN